MILVSSNIRYMRIFVGSFGEGASKDSVDVDDIFLAISVATSTAILERRSALYAVCRQKPTRKPCCGRETA